MPGRRFHLKPPYPCHYYMHGSGRFGLQCLTNLDLLPPIGAVIIAAPLKIKEGSGSPLRVLALVPEPAAIAPAVRPVAKKQKRGSLPASQEASMSADEILAAFPPAERTLPVMLQRQARRYGGARCSWPAMRAVSFDERRDIAARFAGTLAAAGIRPGDRVALMCGNRAEFIESFLGCAWLGAVAVPLNVAARGPQLTHYLQNSGARLLIIEAELLEALAHVDTGRTCARAHLADRRRRACSARAGCPRHPFPPRAEAIAPGADDPAQTLAILYTSGTTGPSKGVCCPHAQYFWWGFNGMRNLEIRARRRALHHAAAVPHQRARHVPSGAVIRRDARGRAALLRLALLAKADRTATRR